MPILNSPRKLYVETTTRCNLRCRMCLKQVPGSKIGDEDMNLTTFNRLIPLLGKASALILNGIGEPLLNPDLERMIGSARGVMPESSIISFQSNGLLLDEKRARLLMAAGLSELCLSIDSLNRDRTDVHGGRGIDRVIRGLAAINQARRNSSSTRFKVGIEIVLCQDNLHELPALIAWAIENNCDFALVTHILPHDEEGEMLSLFNPNSVAASTIFNRAKEEADRLHIDLEGYYQLRWKRGRSDRNSAAGRLLLAMIKEAKDKGAWLNIENLFAWQAKDQALAREIFAKAKVLAKRNHFELFLPPMQPSENHSCRFIEEQAAFISVDGSVSPCHFLWHDSVSYMSGQQCRFRTRSFGSIFEEDPQHIWNRPAYRTFREAAQTSIFPTCRSCALSPCTDITGIPQPFENDCYGNPTPCGSCLWSQGAIRCL